MGMLSLELTFDGHRVRMVGTPERPEWVAKDICRVLEIQGHRRAVAEIVPPEEKGVRTAYTPGGPQEFLTVTEPGLYRLISRSRKPSAARFQSWLFGEVLPSIRRHGCYPPPETEPTLARTDLDDPASLRALLEALTVRRLADQAKIAELAPKADGYDRVSAAVGEISLSEAGRVLGRAPRLFTRQLVADKILFRGADGVLEPRSEYRERGLFRVRLVTVGETEEGDEILKTQTRVTAQGVQWLARRYPRTDRAGSVALLPAVAH